MSSSHAKLESGLQLLARLTKKKFIQNLYLDLFTDGHKPNDIIEIVGENGSGKSVLVCDIIAEAILPEAFNGTEAGVLFINTDGNLSYTNLYQALLSKVKNKLSLNDDPEVVDEIVHSSLGRLQIIEIDNSLEFIVTLQNLESIIANNGNISLLVIDSLTAYYWSEQNNNILKMYVYIRNILKLILKVTKDFQIVVMYTKPLYFNTSKQITDNSPDKVTYQINLNIIDQSNDLIYEATCLKNEHKYIKYFKFCNNNGWYLLKNQ